VVVPKTSGQFPVTFFTDAIHEQWLWRFIIDMDAIYPQIEAALPASITSGSRTDPLRIAAKAMLGYMIREMAMSQQDSDYPAPPVKVPKGEDIVLAQLRYLAHFLGDVLNAGGGLVVTCGIDDDGTPTILGMEIGQDVATTADRDGGPAVSERAGGSEDPPPGSSYLPARSLDDRGHDRLWQDHDGSEAAPES
jgi:hypothetical protein